MKIGRNIIICHLQ